MFIRYLWSDPRLFFSAILIVVLSVSCHEFMHAFVALKMGDDTAARRGHLTLNPLKQMGWLSLVMLLFLGIAWGQVPVNPANFRSRYGRVLTSLAGPLTNLVLWLCFTLGAFVCFKFEAGDFALAMLTYGAVMNLVLFVFNLLPVPGLDGFAVIGELFPELLRSDSEAVKGAFFMLVVLLFVFIDKLFELARVATGFLLLGLDEVCK